MIAPLSMQELERLTGRTATVPARGWCWCHEGRVVAALPVSPLGGADWGTDGIIGTLPDSLAAARLVEHTCRDLKATGARIFVSFSELPGLREAGIVRLLEALGRDGNLQLAKVPAFQDDETAGVVRRAQEDTIDFPEIPPAVNSLDPYLGYGTGLWRRWGEQGIILVNAVDNAVCHLAFVGLAPRYRGRGHGTRLVEDALVLTTPHRKLTAAVDVRNEPACRIYEKLGFTVTEERPVRYRTLNG